MKQKIITEEISRGKLGGNAESVVLKGSSTNNRVTFTIRVISSFQKLALFYSKIDFEIKKDQLI